MESITEQQNVNHLLHGSKTGNRKVVRAHYKRQPKPPYPYLGLIVMAIEMSETKMLMLGGIHENLRKMFPFFAGTYQGWKDSVRHNLSSHACFVRVDQWGIKIHGKGRFWTVDLALVPSNAFHRQDTKVSRKGEWAMELHEQLGVPPILSADGTAPESCRRRLIMTASPVSNISTKGSYSPYSDVSSPEMPESVTKESELSFGITTILNNFESFETSARFQPLDEPNRKRGPSCLSDVSSPFSDDSFVNTNPPKRQRHATESETSTKNESIIKLLASSVQHCQDVTANQDVAAHNLKLLCQHFDFAKSKESDYYYLQNPMDILPGPYRPVPFYYPSPSMWYPPMPSYIQHYNFAPQNTMMYHNSPFIPQVMFAERPVDHTNYSMPYFNAYTRSATSETTYFSNTHHMPANMLGANEDHQTMCSPVSPAYRIDTSPVSVCGFNDNISAECSPTACSASDNQPFDPVHNFSGPVEPCVKNSLHDPVMSSTSVLIGHTLSPIPVEVETESQCLQLFAD